MVQKAVELGAAVPLSARLETRTKESMELAGLQVQSAKPQGVVKATQPRWCSGAWTDPQGAVPPTAAGRARVCAGHLEKPHHVCVHCAPVCPSVLLCSGGGVAPSNGSPPVVEVLHVSSAGATGPEVQWTGF